MLPKNIHPLLLSHSAGAAPDFPLAGRECFWQSGWCHRGLELGISAGVQQSVQHRYGLSQP